jgi:hypothetical protein
MEGRSVKTSGTGLMASLLNRAIGAMTLDAATYEGIESDPRAFIQAVAIVATASVAAAVGAAIPWEGPRLTIAASSVIAALAWPAWATLTLFIGQRLLPGRNTRATFGEHLRTLGFAAAPACFQLLAAFTVTKWPIFLATWAWVILASVVAVRQSLDYESTGRAVAVCLIAAAVVAAVGFLTA